MNKSGINETLVENILIKTFKVVHLTYGILHGNKVKITNNKCGACFYCSIRSLVVYVCLVI